MLYDCDRCGRTCLSEDAYKKANDRGKTPLCRDCQASRLFRVQYATDYCVPHQGLFDLQDNPVNEWGERLYFDEPTCQHRDCVRANHHVEPAAVSFVMPVYESPKKRNARITKFGLIMALAEAQE